MFAPITRSYTEGFGGLGELPDIPPYERNQGDFPISLAGNVAFLDAWQAAFDGDTFDFDYHLMWRHFRDPGYMRISEIVAEDMAALPGIGLNGNVSCQIQRVYLPSSLPMILMGRLLWDGNASIEETTTDYFAAAFDEAAELARGDLEQINDCSPHSTRTTPAFSTSIDFPLTKSKSSGWKPYRRSSKTSRNGSPNNERQRTVPNHVLGRISITTHSSSPNSRRRLRRSVGVTKHERARAGEMPRRTRKNTRRKSTTPSTSSSLCASTGALSSPDVPG